MIIDAIELGEDGMLATLPKMPSWERKLMLMRMAIELFEKVCKWWLS